MRDKIIDLELQASALEPNSEERQVFRDRVVAYTERFIDTIEENKAFLTDQETDIHE